MAGHHHHHNHSPDVIISLPFNATIRRIFQLNYSPSVSGPIKSDIFIVSVDTHNEPSTNLFAHQSLNSPPTTFVHPIWRVLRKITLSRRPETQTGIDRIHFLLKALVTWASDSDSVAFCLCRRGANSLSLSYFHFGLLR